MPYPFVITFQVFYTGNTSYLSANSFEISYLKPTYLLEKTLKVFINRNSNAKNQDYAKAEA
jgi:hypothetical protein